jgi:hypothetical protein
VDSRNRAVVEELIELMNTRDRRPTHLCHPDIEWHWPPSTPGRVAVPRTRRARHLHQLEDGLLRRWWMFGDADKARRRFLAGDRPG